MQQRVPWLGDLTDEQAYEFLDEDGGSGGRDPHGLPSRAGQGLAFRGALADVAEASPGHRRAAVISTLFVVPTRASPSRSSASAS